jgi:hypothetical protein
VRASILQQIQKLPTTYNAWALNQATGK